MQPNQADIETLAGTEVCHEPKVRRQVIKATQIEKYIGLRERMAGRPEEVGLTFELLEDADDVLRDAALDAEEDESEVVCDTEVEDEGAADVTRMS